MLQQLESRDNVHAASSDNSSRTLRHFCGHQETKGHPPSLTSIGLISSLTYLYLGRNTKES